MPVLIRNSERGTHKRCGYQWHWNFIELLKPREEAAALRFGDLIHRSLEVHYPKGTKRGPKPWLAFEKLYKAELQAGKERFAVWADDENVKWRDALDMGVEMMKGFYERYKDMDEEWEVLSSEQVFQIPLLFTPRERREAGIGKIKLMVVGTMDGVWRQRSGPKAKRDIIIKEYKTTGKGVDEVVKALPMDEQAGTYWTYGPQWLWHKGVLPEGTYPKYIYYTIMRKGMPDERPTDSEGRALNKDGTISKKQPSKLFTRERVYRDAGDRRVMHQRVKDEAVEMILKRLGKRKIIKNPGPLFMPNCIGCPFKDPCELDETGNAEGRESILRAVYQKWTPYSAHEMPERW